MISSNIRTITDDGYAIVACVSMTQHHRNRDVASGHVPAWYCIADNI